MSKLTGILANRGFSSNHLIRITEVLLSVLLAVAIADLAWALFPSPTPDENSSHLSRGYNVSGHRESHHRPRVEQPSIALKSLFGNIPDGTDTAGSIEEPVRETSLNLTLKGILADRTSDTKLALIARGSREETVSRVGDNIAGAKIIRIDSRRVILRRNGITESLTMETEDYQPLKIVNTKGASMTGTGGNNSEISSAGEKMISKQNLNHHLENLPQLLKQAKTIPYTKDGEAAGFRVVQIDKGSVLNDLGLQQNDIIKAVNGIPIYSTGEALQAYRRLKTVTAFQVDILRNDQQITLNYSIQ